MGLRRDDGGFGLSKCHSALTPVIAWHSVFVWGRWYGAIGLLTHDRGGDAAPARFSKTVGQA